jgi:hypothetical protein
LGGRPPREVSDPDFQDQLIAKLAELKRRRHLLRKSPPASVRQARP